MAMIGKYDYRDHNDNLLASDLAVMLINFKNHTLKELNKTYISGVQNLISEESSSFKELKRLPVDIIYPGFPKWFRKKQKQENFSEVINQLATVEAMIHILSKLPQYKVLMAHPTQTSSKGDMNSDLILQAPDDNLYHFEISDVVSKTSDTNHKLAKDLNSLFKRYSSNKDKSWKYYIVTSEELWKHAHAEKYDTIKKGLFRYYYEIGKVDGKDYLKLQAKSKSSKKNWIDLTEQPELQTKYISWLEVKFF